MKTHLTLAFALLLICTGAALASTPDGQTPAEETVCDNETGAAFGLCNAYCEAMDCDSDDPQASANACSKVQAKFQNITGRDLPCEVPAVTCPCNDPAVSTLFAAVVAGQTSIVKCETISEGVLISSQGTPAVTSISPPFQEGQWTCSLTNEGVSRGISPAQGLYCAQLLEQAANSQGVTCVPR